MVVTEKDEHIILKCNKCKVTVAVIKYAFDLYETVIFYDIICEKCKNKQQKPKPKCYCGNNIMTKCEECGSGICMKHVPSEFEKLIGG